MAKIDEKLSILYEYVKNYQNEFGYPPTVRDICKDLNVKSTATAHYYLQKLSDKGLITKSDEKKRAITINNNQTKTFDVPLIGTVTAGVPILAVENLDGYYPLPLEFRSEEPTFMLKVKGDSMINAGILDGDRIIVKKQETANNGDIVVALIDDSATVKRFFKQGDKVILHPENDAMDDIIVQNVQIIGIVKGLTRKF